MRPKGSPFNMRHLLQAEIAAPLTAPRIRGMLGGGVQWSGRAEGQTPEELNHPYGGTSRIPYAAASSGCTEKIAFHKAGDMAPFTAGDSSSAGGDPALLTHSLLPFGSSFLPEDAAIGSNHAFCQTTGKGLGYTSLYPDNLSELSDPSNDDCGTYPMSPTKGAPRDAAGLTAEDYSDLGHFRPRYCQQGYDTDSPSGRSYRLQSADVADSPARNGFSHPTVRLHLAV